MLCRDSGRWHNNLTMTQQTCFQALRTVLGEEEQVALRATRQELERTRLDLERARMTAEDYAGGGAPFRPGYTWRDADFQLQRIAREQDVRIDRARDVGHSGSRDITPLVALAFDEQVEAMVAILEGDE